MIRRAAMLDPNTAATLTVDAIWRMCDDMAAAHAALLPTELSQSCGLQL
jgi:alpha-galactosidase